MKKRHMKVVITIILLLTNLIFIGCSKDVQTENPKNNDKLIVYTTLFPLYDFARQIGGEYVEVHSIVPAGADSHDFEPSAKDIIAMNEANIVIYNGAGYETWLEKIIQHIDQQKTTVVDASVGVQLLEIDNDAHSEDGNEAGHNDEEDHEHGHDHLHASGYDPHIWLDPMNAKVQAKIILSALVAVDPAHKADYESNYSRFAAELDQLDVRFKEAISNASKRHVVVSHQAFGYLAERYGFEQIPISGLSTSSEPSTKELQQIIRLVKDYDLQYIAFDALVESKVAKTVQRETGVESVVLYTLENVTKDQMEQGVTYLQLMEENLMSLKKVLDIQ